MSDPTISSVSEPSATSDTAAQPLDNELLARIPLIEDQPLESRAAAFAHIHEELAAALEGADSPRSR